MKIFSFWDSGRENAPEVVRRCLDRWQALNPNAEFIVYDDHTVGDLLDDLPVDVRKLPVQARADILRIRLLKRYGGIWADASTLPMLPLSEWYDEYKEPSGFFVFLASDRYWRFTNYFIIAEPGNYFISALDDRIRAYWSHERNIIGETPGRLHPQSRMGRKEALRYLMKKGYGRSYLKYYRKWYRDLLYPVSSEGCKSHFFPYFWQQYLMMQLAASDPRAAEIVHKMPHRLHDLVHSVQNAEHHLGRDFVPATPTALLTAPIQKLDWRKDWPAEVFVQPDPSRVLH